jgi:ABC-type transport system involved in cytochrome bd biosynthesis fused ATPase/permease subunit
VCGLDLVVEDGAKVALTGRSGAGKSSVLALALRAYDPDTGRVTLGGTDLRRLALADVRSRTAWAPQAPQVLAGSLAANLRLGRPGAPDDELAAALDDVALGPLLDSVGLDGWLGDSGERLSAGERARVALARALLSPADVLLLDEPTAHLDPELSARVLGLLAEQRRTVLLVTHDAAALDGRWRVVPVGG